MITISVYTLIILFFAHYVGDFLLQNKWMGENKSKAWLPLLSHIAVYTVTLGVFTYPMHTSYAWWIYFLIWNTLAHFCIDAYTSQLSRACYEAKNMGAFWKVVGFDQFLHVSCLISSFGALLK